MVYATDSRKVFVCDNKIKLYRSRNGNLERRMKKYRNCKLIIDLNKKTFTIES